MKSTMPQQRPKPPTPPSIAPPLGPRSVNETPRQRNHRRVVETLAMALMRDPNIGPILAPPTARGLADTMLRRMLRQKDVRTALAELVCANERETQS